MEHWKYFQSNLNSFFINYNSITSNFYDPHSINKISSTSGIAVALVFCRVSASVDFFMDSWLVHTNWGSLVYLHSKLNLYCQILLMFCPSLRVAEEKFYLWFLMMICSRSSCSAPEDISPKDLESFITPYKGMNQASISFADSSLAHAILHIYSPHVQDIKRACACMCLFVNVLVLSLVSICMFLNI